MSFGENVTDTQARSVTEIMQEMRLYMAYIFQASIYELVSLWAVPGSKKL